MKTVGADICLNQGCQEKLVQPATGRRRQFCSERCRVAYHRDKLIRERIARGNALLSIYLNKAKQWGKLDAETTRVTLLRLAQDYGIEAVLLAMQAIEQEIIARYERPPRLRKRTATTKRTEIEGEAILGEAEPL